MLSVEHSSIPATVEIPKKPEKPGHRGAISGVLGEVAMSGIEHRPARKSISQIISPETARMLANIRLKPDNSQTKGEDTAYIGWDGVGGEMLTREEIANRVDDTLGREALEAAVESIEDDKQIVTLYGMVDSNEREAAYYVNLGEFKVATNEDGVRRLASTGKGDLGTKINDGTYLGLEPINEALENNRPPSSINKILDTGEPQQPQEVINWPEDEADKVDGIASVESNNKAELLKSLEEQENLIKQLDGSIDESFKALQTFSRQPGMYFASLQKIHNLINPLMDNIRQKLGARSGRIDTLHGLALRYNDEVDDPAYLIKHRNMQIQQEADINAMVGINNQLELISQNFNLATSNPLAASANIEYAIQTIGRFINSRNKI